MGVLSQEFRGALHLVEERVTAPGQHPVPGQSKQIAAALRHSGSAICCFLDTAVLNAL